MRIKLLYLPRFSINPFEGSPSLDRLYVPPLGITTLFSVLKREGIQSEQDDLFIKTLNAGIDLSVFNDQEKVRKLAEEGEENTLEEYGERILNLTRVKGFDVVGISLFDADNPSTLGVALSIAKILKERYGCTVIAGGEIPFYVEETLLRSGFVDYFIPNHFIYPPEFILPQFCEFYEQGREKETAGVEFLENGVVKKNPVKYDEKKAKEIVVPNFDGLPLDLYTYEMKLRMGGEEYTSKILVLPYRFVKGCPYSCAFCRCSTEPFWCCKPVEEVVEDLRFLSQRYNTPYFFFLNSEVNPTPSYTQNFCEALIEEDLGVKWSACANFTGLNEDLLKKMKEAGACRLIFGLESLSPKVLKYIHKPVEINHAESILKLCHELGIWAEIDMICGFPFENVEDVEKNVNFLRKNKRYVKTVYLHRFFLDGLIKEHPEKFGIRLRSVSYKLSSNLRQEGFDEIGGLKWEDRKKLTEQLYAMIKKCIKETGIKENTEAHEIFFLSSLPVWKKLLDMRWERIEGTGEIVVKELQGSVNETELQK